MGLCTNEIDKFQLITRKNKTMLCDLRSNTMKSHASRKFFCIKAFIFSAKRISENEELRHSFFKYITVLLDLLKIFYIF